jgi:DNA-binding FadR family transcriptional regulator
MAPAGALRKLADVSAPVDEADRVYDALRIAIRGGEIVAGQRLASERKLSADLEAGSRVRDPSPPIGPAETREASPQDVLEARWSFEPGLVALVVARATEADFLAMERQLERMVRATNQQAFREAGYNFHLEIAKATRNPLLVDIFEMIIAARARAGWGRLAALNATPEQRAAQIARNRSVVEALRHRDIDAATTLLRDHLARMLDEIGRGTTTS